MTGYVPSPTPADWTWLTTGITSGDVLVPGEARSRVFDMIRAGWWPTLDRLLTFTTDDRAPIRRTVLELLGDLSADLADRPEVADAAERALTDPDAAVRRTAAALLARAAEPGRALAALHASADPVLRIALTATLTWNPVPGPRELLDHLRADPTPAVRLLANIALFDRADPAAWPVLDARIRADLEASAGTLDAPGHWLPSTPGTRWARMLTVLDREEDCYAWAQRLAGPAESTTVQLEGVRMARAAMRRWRAGPARLAPVLAALLPTGAREAAVRALASSPAASRIAADDLAALLDDPELGPAAALGLGSAGDHRATPGLTRLMLDGGCQPRVVQAFRALARAGADPALPVAAARRILATRPNSSEPVTALRVLAAFGPAAGAAVPELAARVRNAENDTPDLALHALGRIGPAAAAAVPDLEHYPLARFWVTRDRALADQHLAARPEVFRRGRVADAEVLTWLAEHGGLTARQHGQLRSLFAGSGFPQVNAARAIWLVEGPEVAGELLAVLPAYLFDDMYGPEVLRTLAGMGAHARPVLGLLDEFIDRRRRGGFNIGDADAEMRADEMMLAATVAARERISCGPAAW
ncbi:hypothetical protein [Actinoplanes sp. L3-i22]|uniref:hypothetical protein n=1 Tax=Actinoplanes sp. L3-i22 TaxID=2836373 RepID=UPI001C790B71|nr:hypothetical protein [Actinoplanes sp. L3-i22]BCY07585.1 hypothetical protein L3i22_026730 [Actinoplanes sp. L3-i22]